MFLLRLNQLHAEPANHYCIEVEVRDEHGLAHKATSVFDFALTDDDLKDMQWYMEDLLQYPLDPAPAIATRVEQRMKDIGVDLFRKVFTSNDDVTKRWNKLSDHIADTRIEIITDVQEANSIPWELLRDPAADTPLALQARSFVRANLTPAQDYVLPTTEADEPIRILLVICRPGGRADVEVSGPKASYTANFKRPHIITVASGQQQTYARWTFEPGSTQPLVGDQRVRVELRVQASGRVRARAFLSVEVASALGPIKGLLPQNDQSRFNWVLQ